MGRGPSCEALVDDAELSSHTACEHSLRSFYLHGLKQQSRSSVQRDRSGRELLDDCLKLKELR